MKCLSILLFFSINVFAVGTVEQVKEIKSFGITKIVLDFSSDLLENPSISKNNKYVEILIPGAKLTSNSKVHLSPDHGVEIKEENSGIVLVIPKASIVANKMQDLSLKVSKKQLVAMIPLKEKIIAIAPSLPINKSIKEEEFEKVIKEKSNLDYLIDDFRKTAVDQEKIPFNEDSVENLLQDKVITSQTSQLKKDVVNLEKPIKGIEEKNTGFEKYLIKLVLALGGIIGVFVILVNLFRKKVLGKNKLGFLHNSKLVEVVGTTHISPKKNLLLVRVHEQYLLLSNTESGINFLTEITDQAGLLRMGETEITGSNFDTNLVESASTVSLNSHVKEKSNIYESSPVKNKQTNFSSHIKRKLRKTRDQQSNI